MMERALADYIVNALWQIPLLAGGAWLLLRVARPGPKAQHRVWLGVLALCVLLPLRGMDKPGVFASPAAVVTQEFAGREEPINQRRPWFEPDLSLKTRTVHLNASATHWLVRIYLATVVLTLFRLTHAWSASRRLVADAQVTTRHDMALAHYSQRFRVKLPEVRESAQVSSPMIVGAVTPVLLLPEGFFGLTEDEMRATLCHELAHVQRRDYLMNLLCQVAALPVTWHPVVTQVQQSIRTTREMVCDAMAAQEMQSHIGYARCLLALAHSMLGGTGRVEQRQFLGLFTNNTLEKRVMLLMETTKMTVHAKVARAASGAVVMIAAGTVAAMFHVTPTMAEQRADAPQAAMQAAPAAAPSEPGATTPAASPAAIKRTDKKRVMREKRVAQNTEQRSEDIQRAMAKAKVVLDDPEFKERMEDAQRQVADAKVMIDSQEFKQRIEDIQRKMSNVTVRIDNKEFKRQMEDARRQMADVRVTIDSPEFEQQMEDAQRQMAKVRVVIDSPEFKRQMEDVQREMAKVRVKIDGLMGPCSPDGKPPAK